MTNTKFPTEIAKYFRDFLETNFHKRKAPKRSFKTRNDKNLLVGINLKNFDGVRGSLYKSLQESNALPITIEKGRYTTGISSTIIEIVERYGKSIQKDVVDRLSGSIEEYATQILKQNPTDLDICKDKISEKIRTEFSGAFFVPLVQMIESPLKTAHSFDEEMISNFVDELSQLLNDKFRPEVSNYVISNQVEKKNYQLNLAVYLTVDVLEEIIVSYFSELKTEDLFFEINELVNNLEIIDKQELYLYFFDIKYDGSTYPLLYVPLSCDRDKTSVTFSLDSTIYINKKAVDYIAENFGKETDKIGSIKNAENRFIYANEDNSSSIETIENLANEILNYCDINGIFTCESTSLQSFKNHKLGLSNNCYLAIFDKSDESLINDYEELISIMNLSDGVLGKEFCSLIEGFLANEPLKIISSIEKEWDETEVTDRLVNISPIPLNEEQNQIISALKRSNCKYVSVEGPPGTGKSHTITAIVFNSILENKSTLVLSDKAEALDVVEDKITKTLNTVRFSDDFQNPILRLGKSGNTYSKILSSESLDKIKTQHKAVSKNERALNDQIETIKYNLKEKIQTEIKEYSSVNIEDIILFQKLEDSLSGKKLDFVADEELLLNNGDFIEDLESCFQVFREVDLLLEDRPSLAIKQYFKIFPELQIPSIKYVLQICNVIKALKIRKIETRVLRGFGSLEKKTITKLKGIALNAKNLKSPIFGYFFKDAELKTLLAEFRSNFDIPEIVNLKSDLPKLFAAIEFCEEFEIECLKQGLSSESVKYSIIADIGEIEIDDIVPELTELLGDLEEIEEFQSNYPLTSKELNLIGNFSTDCKLLQISDEDFEQIGVFLRLKSKLEKSFKNIPKYNFVKNKTSLENLYTARMTNILDSRVVDFSENQSARAKTLRKIISSKKRFPKEEFVYLKNAFPCIISGIRDYAEYIPLDHGMFDLVIIDEASQVSIAQALPAILRAKQVVVFGDQRQFSNIKSAQAKSEINTLYLQQIKSSIISTSNPSASALERLAKFNIKTSVLDFFEFICNYKIKLRKHFRGYKELISYSSKHFYTDHLQAIKIRSKPVEDVIEFLVDLEHDGKLDILENTNLREVDRIVAYLETLLQLKEAPSIGIITPHTNQQKVLIEKIHAHKNYEELCKRNKIKIMTFDTCQGEERDIIIYSMVAHKQSDKLKYIFITKLTDIDFDEENKIKAQRLNVGFSRAKEKMVFFLSKPVDEFTGTIGDALRHYKFVLEKGKTLPSASDVDSKSPMEAKVLGWIQETSFFKENIGSIELKAQFPIGDYLKQLDPTYSHAKYVCDFLFLFKDEYSKSHHIIIEYDGFKEHFSNLKAVNELNYSTYYSDEHIYREKVLEGYGYKFLRINRFNMGKDPILTLDTRIRSLVNNVQGNTNWNVLKNIQQTAASLEEGSLKECLKCGSLKPLSEFRDKSLTTGIGRTCLQCKNTPVRRKRERKPKYASLNVKPLFAHTSAESSKCPKCGSSMVSRAGKYGKFLGCSTYPRCKGTRPVS